jgi:hypothetical protein
VSRRKTIFNADFEHCFPLLLRRVQGNPGL